MSASATGSCAVGRMRPPRAELASPSIASFAVRGRGTVVTGSLRGGPLDRRVAAATRCPVDLSPRPRAPGPRPRRGRRRGRPDRDQSRRRGLGRGRARCGPDDGSRGRRLRPDPRRAPSGVAFGRPWRLPDLPGDRARVLVHLGTARVPGVVGRSGRDTADLPGGERTAILRLAEPIAVAPGDVFVLRRPSPGHDARRRPRPRRRAAARRVAPPDDAGAARGARGGTRRQRRRGPRPGSISTGRSRDRRRASRSTWRRGSPSESHPPSRPHPTASAHVRSCAARSRPSCDAA